MPRVLCLGFVLSLGSDKLKKRAPQQGAFFWYSSCHGSSGEALFDLGFLEGHMFADHRVVFAEFHLFGGVPWVLLCHVVITGISGADQFDQDCC